MQSSVCLLAAAVLIVTGCGSNNAEHIAEVTTGGNAKRGAIAISHYGCGACHVIPGISGAEGKAGPPLTGIADRIYLAGELQNTPENMVRWIQNPQAVNPQTVMPNVGLTLQEARDVAGYLYTLK